MRVAALIVEYNPLHNGHLYQIAQARSLVGPSGAIIAIMSGNVCQRGELACLDKITRAKLAVELGVDLVLELPTLAVLASANYFAKAAISLINSLNCVDYVICGVESQQINLLSAIAKLLSTLNPDLSVEAMTLNAEQQIWQQNLQQSLKSGLSYAAAITKLLTSTPYSEQLQTILGAEKLSSEILAACLSKPNNILAISYLQAKFSLPKPDKSWRFHFMTRQEGKQYLSAHKIRDLLNENKHRPAQLLNKLLNFLPAQSLAYLIKATYTNKLVTANNLDLPFRLYLSQQSYLHPEIISESSYTQRLKKESQKLDLYLNSSMSEVQKELAQNLSHKGQSMANCKRNLLKSLLNLENYSLMDLHRLLSKTHYLRVLAYSSYPGRAILKRLKKECPVPLIMRFSDFYQKQTYTICKADFYALAEADYRATNFYASLISDKQCLDKQLILAPIKVKRQKPINNPSSLDFQLKNS